MHVKEVVSILEKKGIPLTKKFGSKGGIPQTTFAPYFEGNYLGLKFTLVGLTSPKGYTSGVKIKFFYSQRTYLGFLCKYNCGNLSMFTYNETYKDILSKKIETTIKGVQCYAHNHKLINNLFNDKNFVSLLEELKYELNINEQNNNESGFFINDSCVGVLMTSNENIEKVFETIYKITYFLDRFWQLNSNEVLKERTIDKVFKTIVILLTIIFIVVIVLIITFYS